MTTRLVCGKGVNDCYDQTLTKVVGEPRSNPIYSKWSDMIRRCYSKKSLYTRPSYAGCIVCNEWLYFSNFKSWMEKQDWEGKQLDKDLLSAGNKLYSPETCVLVDAKVNIFVINRKGDRGDLMLGVYFNKETQKLRAQCSNPFTGNRGYLGYFTTELEAHKAWQAKKHEYACQLAELQEDSRVADALRQRYAPDKDWTKA